MILNAGLGTGGALADFPVRRIDKTLEVNLVSAAVLIQSALPMLRLAADADPERGSTIVGLSSLTGVFAEPGLGIYGASKAAPISLLNTVNVEESGRGVKATDVAPGYVDTDMASWTTGTIPADTMIRVEDVVGVIEMFLGLGRDATIPTIAITQWVARMRGLMSWPGPGGVLVAY